QKTIQKTIQKTTPKARGAKPRHVPQRTCIACRQVAGKRSLLRVARTAEGVVIDPTGKQPGRGAYLHPYQTCWQAVLRGGRLGQALRTRLSADERKRLEDFMQTLPRTEAESNAADANAADVNVAEADRGRVDDQAPDSVRTVDGRRILDVYLD
ncbi:MAG: YlxR family protein, partial [Litorilinea sp.]